MLKVKIWIMLITLFSLIVGVTGCTNSLPIGLTHDLERASDTKFGSVALIDSSTGQTKYLISANGGTSNFFDKPQPASEIKEVTTVSVVGVSGIAGYQSCNYITIDSRQVKSTDTRLICRNNENRKSELRDSDKASEIPTLPENLVNRLADTGSINNLGFLILTDIITGKTKLFRSENYVDLPISFPLPVTEIKNNNVWSVITFVVNPCSSCTTNSQGEQVCKYVTYCPK
ncbi:MAG: hypothetical protein HRU78_14130 [Gammaproteobacteria bacterium]|nr:MAG: hypothetical protein HRU78_14130 [Gammaproteobacteria bacterium]